MFFVVACKHCITVLEGRLSLGLGLVPDEADRVCDGALGADLALALWREVVDDADGFFFFSSSVVTESTEMVVASSTVDSPAAGMATSPAPKVIVVSALDPDAISVRARRQSQCVCRQSLRLITCVRVCIR